MSIRVTDFKYIPGKNDAEYIMLLKQTLENERAITQKAVSKVKELSKSGHWEWDENGMDWGLGAWKCSECHTKPETWWEADKKNNPYRCSGSHYCGNCGAKMGAVV